MQGILDAATLRGVLRLMDALDGINTGDEGLYLSYCTIENEDGNTVCHVETADLEGATWGIVPEKDMMERP